MNRGIVMLCESCRRTCESCGRRLEAKEYPPLDPPNSKIYFDIEYEDFYVEEDAERGDEKAQRLLNDPEYASQQEFEAIDAAEELLGVPVANEGHDRYGALICKFRVNTVDDVWDAVGAISSQQMNQEGHVDLIEYFRAGGWELMPQGVNGPVYSYAPARANVDGSIREWLEHQ